MFIFLATGNLLWIIWSMIMIEMTLNYNHVANVLGENGRIFFPSQLIPLTISVCGFFRVVYLRWEQWRNPGFKPSLADDPPVPQKQSTIPKGKSFFKMFSPGTLPPGAITPGGGDVQESVKMVFEDSDLDPDMEGQPAWWRYLASWLPWLAALRQWWNFSKESPTPIMSQRDILEPSHKLRPPESDLEQGRRRGSTMTSPERSSSSP
jgi:hypothetical protein